MHVGREVNNEHAEIFSVGATRVKMCVSTIFVRLRLLFSRIARLRDRTVCPIFAIVVKFVFHSRGYLVRVLSACRGKPFEKK